MLFVCVLIAVVALRNANPTCADYATSASLNDFCSTRARLTMQNIARLTNLLQRVT